MNKQQQQEERRNDKRPVCYVDGRAWRPVGDDTLAMKADRDNPPKFHHIGIPDKTNPYKRIFLIIVGGTLIAALLSAMC